VYPHIGDFTNLAGYPPLKPKIIFCVFLLDHNLSLSMDRQFEEDRKMVLRLKILSISPKEKLFLVPTLSVTSLPEDEQMSKHGGGGRYNAVLEFKGSKLKKERNKEKEKMSIKKKRKKKYIYIYMRRRETKYEYV
jgi:hypothetical protein